MQVEKDTYARIIDNLRDGLYFVDTNRAITYWNKGAEPITGFSAAEVVNRQCSDNILTHVDIEGNCLERELHARFEEMKRVQVPFGILFIDIDHFKVFNDTYGHDVGDQVLKFVAMTFVANSRPFDLYGRWGRGVCRRNSQHRSGGTCPHG